MKARKATIAETKRYGFATWLRVFAMVCILMCHFANESPVAYVKMSSQLFNIGVPIFFMLSGFVFGTRNNIGGGVISPIAWYGRRLKRIFIPYELFVIVLAVVSIICGKKILTVDWLLLALGLQGSVVGVNGAGQTWFITAILICYAVTPFLGRFWKWAGAGNDMTWSRENETPCHVKAAKPEDPERTGGSERVVRSTRLVTVVVTVSMVPAALAFVPISFVPTLLSPVAWYAIAYLIGMRFDRVRFTKGRTLAAFFVIVISFGCRFAMRFFLDGTVWYDGIISGYTHVLAALGIGYVFAVIFEGRKELDTPVSGSSAANDGSAKNEAGSETARYAISTSQTKDKTKKVPRVIEVLSCISFEVYLYHYMFCVGPVRLFGLTPWWAADCAVVLAVTLVVSYVANLVTRRFSGNWRSKQGLSSVFHKSGRLQR